MAPGRRRKCWALRSGRRARPKASASALDEFLEIGYHGATVRGIAARCGLSVSGIYHYYTSKQQMLVTILDLAMAELLMRARAAHLVAPGWPPHR
jgi:AcrR family transcriptional regulator